MSVLPSDNLYEIQLPLYDTFTVIAAVPTGGECYLTTLRSVERHFREGGNLLYNKDFFRLSRMGSPPSRG